MKYKNIVIVCLTLIIFLMLGCIRNHEDVSRSEIRKNKGELPNIIFFLSDDQDIYDFGCYGNKKVKTFAVDRLAREGILFENAFTGQAICAPSRSQLLTGLYPLKNGCFANHTRTKPDVVSLTKMMRARGYEVVLAGKSHLQPANVFDWDKAWKGVPKEGVPRDYVPLDSIESYFKSAQQPFFMLVASYLPHAAYFEVEDTSVDSIQFYPFNDYKKGDISFVKRKAGYYRSIEEDNIQLDKVLNLVDEYLGENTVFMYSADHGVSGKFSVKDVGLRVPFIVRWPKVIEPGSTSDQLIHYVDVLPTLVDITGGNTSTNIDGQSFLPLLKGEEVTIHEYIYGVRTNQNILRSEIFPSRMIRDKQYKYIRNFNALEVLDKNLTGNPRSDVFIRRGANAFKNEQFEELYDLRNDPFEQTNLIDQPDLNDIKGRLKDQLFIWMKEQDDFLNEDFGNIPILTAPNFKLDENTRLRTIPDSLKNKLNEEDYLVVDHWR